MTKNIRHLKFSGKWKLYDNYFWKTFKKKTKKSLRVNISWSVSRAICFLPKYLSNFNCQRSKLIQFPRLWLQETSRIPKPFGPKVSKILSLDSKLLMNTNSPIDFQPWNETHLKINFWIFLQNFINI